ncbi:hypothetical protein EYC84_000630 [Monilinia fructicola]|uniref:Uncharacterized protein n=1 Tax=Monilinia fructicola TaxID=38448 RepID=A0A5M9JRQ1_MONFR|nr:hypothetical protein EYC84_000630 [Monilinia fructicola]
MWGMEKTGKRNKSTVNEWMENMRSVSKQMENTLPEKAGMEKSWQGSVVDGQADGERPNEETINGEKLDAQVTNDEVIDGQVAGGELPGEENLEEAGGEASIKEDGREAIREKVDGAGGDRERESRERILQRLEVKSKKATEVTKAVDNRSKAV